MDRNKIPLPQGAPLRTLGEARSELRDVLATGKAAICPCCSGVTKVYARSLYGSMVVALNAIAHAEPKGLAPSEVLALPQIGGGDYVKLTHWGLIYRGKETDNRWRATVKGIAFLRGHIELPHRVFLFGDQPIGFDSSTLIRVGDVSSKRVDLDEILSSWAVETKSAAA